MSRGGGFISSSPLKMIVYTKGRDAVYIYAVEAIIFDFYGKHQIHEVNCCSACTSRFFFTDGGDEGVSGRFRLNRSVAM